MKNLTRFLLICVLGCATPPPAKNIILRSFPEKIDLNRVGMIPVRSGSYSQKQDKDGPEEIPIYENEKKEPYLFLNLKYADSGLNIIELIKKGEIIAHSVIVRNSKGEMIGEESLNFTAFTRTETIVIEQGIVVSDDNSKNPIPELDRKSTRESTFSPKEYSDSDLIPQSISFLRKENSYAGRKEPAEGEVISIYLELVYVSPFFQEYCLETNANCEAKRSALFSSIAQKNKERLAIMQSEMQRNMPVKFENKKDKAEKEAAKELNTTQIKAEINAINGGLWTNATPTAGDEYLVAQPKNPASYADGHYLNYREYSLVSVPKFFKIKGRVDKNGKPIGGEKKLVLPTASKDTEVNAESPFEHKEGDHETHEEDRKKDPRRKRKEVNLP